MAAPETSHGYTPYEQYTLSKWVLHPTTIVLLTVAAIFSSEHVVLIPENSIKLIIGMGIAFMTSLYIHESLHYVTNSILSYDPVYKWPNIVYVPGVSLDLWEITVVLLAPQFLSVIYIVLLATGAVNDLAMVIGWGLIFNFGGAGSDILWVIRRLTWPNGTKVVVGDDETNYVAFPIDSL